MPKKKTMEETFKGLDKTYGPVGIGKIGFPKTYLPKREWQKNHESNLV